MSRQTRRPVGVQLALELLSAPYSREAQAGEKAQAENEKQEYILKKVMVRWNPFHTNPPRCINERQLRGKRSRSSTKDLRLRIMR
jgi:hypothetical protein